MDSWGLDCSDAGNSGWTMYLDNSSSVSLHPLDYHDGETKQEQDEDSSMLSDASSGPPYYCEELVSHKAQQKTQSLCEKKNKVKEEQRNSERFNSCLDDTASSLPFGEEASAHKQYRDEYQRLDDFSQSYSTRRVFKGNLKSGSLHQAFPIDKLALDHQGGNNQRKRRG